MASISGSRGTAIPGGMGEPPERRDQALADVGGASGSRKGPSRMCGGFVQPDTDGDVDVVQEPREVPGEITPRRPHELGAQKRFGDADNVK